MLPANSTSQRHFVVDASVAIKAFVEEEESAQASALLALIQEPDAELHVPELFFIEMTNIFWKCVQRGRLTLDDAKASVLTLPQLRLIAHPMTILITQAFDLAATYNISAYDAGYIALAAQLKLPLITADNRLIEKLVGTPYVPVLLSQFPI